MNIDFTAVGRYYKVYRDGEYVSQHTTEREACQKCINLAFASPNSAIEYIHEYRVTVEADIAPTHDPTPDPKWGEIPDQSINVNEPYSLDLMTFAENDWPADVTFSIVSGALPTGLSLVGSEITGTPTVAGEETTVSIEAQL